MGDTYDIRDDGTVLVRVHVQPGAGRTQVVGRHGDALKVRVAAPPEKGRANDAVTALLADLLGAAPADVTVESGATSRGKRIAVKGVDAEEAARRLDRALGGSEPAAPDPTRRIPR